MLYPNDANGDVLRRMEAQGDDLTKPRNIDFTVTFADAISAEQFAEHFRAFGHKVSVRFSATDQDFPWYVIVVQHMVPSHEGITDFENLLQSLADGWGGVPVARRGCASWGDWGGHNDGWGCFSQATVSTFVIGAPRPLFCRLAPKAAFTLSPYHNFEEPFDT